jgi:2,3-diketo-5-methylthio-1-phosphopentane phosphatase
MKRKLHIFCDFDGTITKGDTTDFLLEELADPAWRDVEKEWEAGKIGSKECMQKQVPLIRGGTEAVIAALKSVKVEQSFAPFANWCRQKQIPLTIVSDGIDFVIRHILSREEILVNGIIANHLSENEFGYLSLSSPKQPGYGASCSSGVCKCQVLSAEVSNPVKVVIGDGRSDFCWAPEADILFAKSKLYSYCQTNNIACRSFANFSDIRMALEEILVPQTAQEIAPQFVQEFPAWAS